VSRASVQENGPFSRFPDHTRVIVVLDGNGLLISHDQGKTVTEVKPLQPYEFDGELDTRCELVAGAIKDFNVFYKKNIGVRPEVTVVKLATATIHHSVEANSFIHVLSGELEVALTENQGQQPIRASQDMSIHQTKKALITCTTGPTTVIVVKGIC